MDERVVEAAKILAKEGIVKPIVITDEEIDGVETISISKYEDFDGLVARAMEIRKGK
jgi:phosphate acetyltransferase